ncbi:MULTISPECIES: hypothetical protein [unclassified Streptomyces]|uniref:hypothetical protein n=1 Tax=Streptomyces sp. NBRC 14336 TaxID=3030992 RepID=UPI002557551A|nr:hypothetical protein [Streptomyces sp. NBRC 14336]
MSAAAQSDGNSELPPAGTVREPRQSLSLYGFPGDRQKFDAEMDTVIAGFHAEPTSNDLDQVRDIITKYRHRLFIRYTPSRHGRHPGRTRPRPRAPGGAGCLNRWRN